MFSMSNSQSLLDSYARIIITQTNQDARLIPIPYIGKILFHGDQTNVGSLLQLKCEIMGPEHYVT